MIDWLNRQWIPFERREWHTLADRAAFKETHNLTAFLESLGLVDFKVYHGPTHPQFDEPAKQFDTNKELLFTCSQETFFAFKKILAGYVPPHVEIDRWMELLECPA